MLIVDRCFERVVRCMLVVGRPSLLIVCCLLALFVACVLVLWDFRLVIGRLLFLVGLFVCVGCCVLFVARCVLRVACWLLVVVVYG